jgi:hypothetical protein
MSKAEIKRLEEALLVQRKQVSSSRVAAEQLLKKLDIYHLLEPKGSQKTTVKSAKKK